MIYLFWISKSCQKNFQDLEKFKNMGKLPDSITLGKNVWWWEKVEERRQKSLESCQMHKNFQSKNSFLMISWRLVRLRKKLTPKIFWLMMKFQFSVTTKFFVIESSSKILETRALDSCQMHKNFQSKIHSCWSLGDWWDLEKKLRNKIFLVDDEVSVLSKYQIFASLNWAVKSYLLKLHARRKKLMVEMLSKKTHRPNGATKDSLTLGNKRPSN